MIQLARDVRLGTVAVVSSPCHHQREVLPTMLTTIEIPTELARFELPEAVQARLQRLLDQQDAGEGLTPDERREAEGLVELAEFLSLLRLRSLRPSSPS
jgi:hypothetical protein